MTDIDNYLPSARQALVQAHQRLLTGEHEAADTWISLAREIRHGSQRREPAAERALTLHDVEAIVCVHGRCAVRRSGGPGSWFLHSDDGSVCDGPENQASTDWARRRPKATDERDLFEPHGTTLDGEPAYGSAAPTTTRGDLRESETTKLLDVSRFRPQLVDGLEATAVIETQPRDWQVGDETACAHCPYPIYVYADWQPEPVNAYGPKVWIHRATAQRVCPTPQGMPASGDESHHPAPAHTFAEPLPRGTVEG